MVRRRLLALIRPTVALTTIFQEWSPFLYQVERTTPMQFDAVELDGLESVESCIRTTFHVVFYVPKVYKSILYVPV